MPKSDVIIQLPGGGVSRWRYNKAGRARRVERYTMADVDRLVAELNAKQPATP